MAKQIKPTSSSPNLAQSYDLIIADLFSKLKKMKEGIIKLGELGNLQKKRRIIKSALTGKTYAYYQNKNAMDEKLILLGVAAQNTQQSTQTNQTQQQPNNQVNQQPSMIMKLMNSCLPVLLEQFTGQAMPPMGGNNVEIQLALSQVLTLQQQIITNQQDLTNRIANLETRASQQFSGLVQQVQKISSVRVTQERERKQIDFESLQKAQEFSPLTKQELQQLKINQQSQQTQIIALLQEIRSVLLSLQTTGKTAMVIIGLAVGIFLYESGMLQKLTDIITKVLQEILQEDPNYFLPQQLHPNSSTTSLLSQSNTSSVKNEVPTQSLEENEQKNMETLINPKNQPSKITSLVKNLSNDLTALQPDQSQTTKLISYALLATAVDYLPDLKGALAGFYEENVKETVETKTQEFKELIQQNATIVAVSSAPKASKSSPKSKHSALDYYNCLLNYANQNWHHPVTGEKKKITACCRDCKQNAPALNSEKDKELVKLITSYKQVGVSLNQVGDTKIALYVIAGAFGVILALLAMFFGYNLTLGKRTAKLEKKNGHEQYQIEELRAGLEKANNSLIFFDKERQELKKEVEKLKNESLSNLPKEKLNN
ncbi:5558_t:CDS:10 [Funneliformis geosporum]|nr:5558_t:CDS:10 [Funneliformis geosporum]